MVVVGGRGMLKGFFNFNSVLFSLLVWLCPSETKHPCGQSNKNITSEPKTKCKQNVGDCRERCRVKHAVTLPLQKCTLHLPLILVSSFCEEGMAILGRANLSIVKKCSLWQGSCVRISERKYRMVIPETLPSFPLLQLLGSQSPRKCLCNKHSSWGYFSVSFSDALLNWMCFWHIKVLC